jgi:hypothetical protein
MAMTLQQKVNELVMKLRPQWSPDKLSDAAQYLMRCGMEQQGWKPQSALSNLSAMLEEAVTRPGGPVGTYTNNALNTFSPQYDSRKQVNVLANEAAQLSFSKGPYAAYAVAKAQAAQAPSDAAKKLILQYQPARGQDILEAFINVLTATTGASPTQALAALNDVAFGVRGAPCRDRLVASVQKVG